MRSMLNFSGFQVSHSYLPVTSYDGAAMEVLKNGECLTMLLYHGLSRKATGGPAVTFTSSASMDQYCCGSKLVISRSRSITSRRATDCTCPADSPRRLRAQDTKGLGSYPISLSTARHRRGVFQLDSMHTGTIRGTGNLSRMHYMREPGA